MEVGLVGLSGMMGRDGLDGMGMGMRGSRIVMQKLCTQMPRTRALAGNKTGPSINWHAHLARPFKLAGVWQRQVASVKGTTDRPLQAVPTCQSLYRYRVRTRPAGYVSMEAMSEEEIIGGGRQKGVCWRVRQCGRGRSFHELEHAEGCTQKARQSPVWSRAEKSYPPARMKMGKYGSSHKGNRYVRHASQQLWFCS